MLIYQVAFIITVLLDIIIAALSFNRNKNIAFVMVFSMFTALFYLLCITFDSYFISSLCSSLYFLSIDYLLYFLVLFVYDFINYEFRPFVKNTLLVWLFLDTIFLLINPFKEIAISYSPVLFAGHTIYEYNPGLLYDSHLLFCYVMITISLFMMIHKMSSTPRLYKRRYLSSVLSILFVVLLNVFYLVGFNNFQLDLSLIFYSICGMLIYFNVFFYAKKQQPMLIRDVLMDNLGGPIAFFDYEDRLSDYNKQMGELLPSLVKDEDSLQSFSELYAFPQFKDVDRVFEWTTVFGGEEHIYNCNYRCIRDDHEQIVGKVIQMSDTTYSKDRLTNLELAQGLYHYGLNLDFDTIDCVQMLVINVTSLRMINSALGHNKGNQVMLETMSIIFDVVGVDTYVAKLEDGSFVAMLVNVSMEYATIQAKQIQQLVLECDRFDFKYEVEYGICQMDKNNKDIYRSLDEALVSLRNKKMMNENSVQGDLIQSLTQTLLESDYETEEHVVRTKNVSAKIGQILGLSDKELGELALLSILHDIGKIAIPNHILVKPGRLTKDEWEIMKTHTEKGCRIAKASDNLQPIADCILYHHERYDGTGYPARLKGEEIPLLARIISVVDSFDVMTHDRPYHKAVPLEEAKKELIRCSGSQFDPKIVDAYLTYLESESIVE